MNFDFQGPIAGHSGTKNKYSEIQACKEAAKKQRKVIQSQDELSIKKDP